MPPDIKIPATAIPRAFRGKYRFQTRHELITTRLRKADAYLFSSGHVSNLGEYYPQAVGQIVHDGSYCFATPPPSGDPRGWCGYLRLKTKRRRATSKKPGKKIC